MRTFFSRMLPAVVAWVVLPTAASAQQSAIVGRVTDRAAGTPIADASVVIVGSQLGARTNEQGRYRIANVAPGTYNVRVTRLGYGAITRPVTVTAGAEATLDFDLGQTAVTIDQVLVTATGESQRKRETGNAVSTVQPAPQQLAVSTTVADVLAGQAPGVNVSFAGGTAGQAARIRIRGANSVSLSNEPLIIIDGVRVSNDFDDVGRIGVGGQVPQRLNDLNPDDIESMEILKGPAASALYGTAAANGVIQIRTKRGHSGGTRWTAYGEGGSQKDVYDYPANYARIGITRAGKRTTGCTLNAEVTGGCTPFADSLVSFNPLVDASPFVTGRVASGGVSVSGGGDAATYFLSGDLDQNKGVFAPNHFRRTSIRANVNGQLARTLNAQVSTNYVASRLAFPQNDNNILGILGSGLLGFAFDDPPPPAGTGSRGYLAGQTPQEIYAIDWRENVERFIGSTNLNWTPLTWFSGVVTGGVDFYNRRNDQTVPPNTVFFGSLPDGQRTANTTQEWQYTANASGTGTFDLTPALHSSTTAGVQYNEEQVAGTQAFGAKLLAGTGSLQGTSARFSVGETNTDNRTIGGLLQQEFGWRDRLFLTGAVRTDNNSAFGANFGWITYPAASLSWVASEEPFFPHFDAISSLRLRTAYGKSGQRPNFRDAITYFDVQTVTVNGADQPGIQVGGTGNPNLRPEVSREFEGGFDLQMFTSRLGLEATYYNKRTNDLLIARPLPPSLGLTRTQFANLGSSANAGLELGLNSHILDMRDLKFDLNGTYTTNSNKLITLGKLPTGQDVPPIVLGKQQHRTGYPLGGYWDRGYTYADANGDGIIAANELTTTDTVVYLGNPFPRRQWSLSPHLTLFRYAEVTALLDHKGGYKLYNLTSRFRCNFSNCQEAYDRSAPLWEQARNIGQLAGTDAGYVEDATFTKLREVAVTLTAPTDWARYARVSSLRLTLAGRNLHTWTNYSGFDPEVNSTPNSNFNTSDFLTEPPLRVYTARLSVTF
ncbi:MAG TPA: SusC/RagA family TonB-linked outer membrane protein [Gemmatimonadaceae bacterium]|nr:SusC/RagA family TonB-linked outer membrane protein [Gemmatimonadaceae bacterium]